MRTSTASTLPKSARFVLFGALGDLTWRLVVPALFDLHREHQRPEDFQLIGVDRDIYSRIRWLQRCTVLIYF